MNHEHCGRHAEMHANKKSAPHLSDHSRAVSFSPVITRRNDSIQFTIPKKYEVSPEMRRRIHDISPESRRRVLEDMDHNSMPMRCGVKALSEESMNQVGKSADLIGNIDLELWYSGKDEMLLVRLKGVNIVATPSPSVIGSTWVVKPECRVQILPQKNKFWEALGSKGSFLTPSAAVYIAMKKSCLREKSLRITCYDSKKKNCSIPIGHVFVSLKDLFLSTKTFKFTKPIKACSEPAGFNRGEIETSMLWISSTDKLEIRLGKLTDIKSPRGVLKRNFYAKISVFVAGEEVKHWKTQAKFADPDVTFDETVIVSLNNAQLVDSTVLVYVFAKQIVKLSITSELIGTTIIGPYMPKGTRSLTQWERVLAKPFEEFTEKHKLYL